MGFALMQWNCMYSEDLGKITDFIKSIDPDIVCLQELTESYHDAGNKAGEQIARALGYHHHCIYGPMVLPDGVHTLMGVGILSRQPFASARSTIIQKGETDGPRVLRDERFYLEATFSMGGHEVKVGTTHLPFHPRFQTTKNKQQMVERILSLVPVDAPYILAGDLNTTPRTKAAMTFRRAGLKNAGPSLIQPTWTTKPFSIGPWTYDELRFRLDYVLHNTGFIPVKATKLKTNLSDHLPILVEFEFVK